MKPDLILSVLTRTKIEAVFDKQISKIEDAIEAQLNVIADHFAAGREHCQIMSPNVVVSGLSYISDPELRRLGSPKYFQICTSDPILRG